MQMLIMYRAAFGDFPMHEHIIVNRFSLSQDVIYQVGALNISPAWYVATPVV